MSDTATEERPDIISVDSSTFDKFVDEKLNGPGPTPEEAAAKELQKVEAEKAERLAAEKAAEDPTHELDEVPKDKKDRLNERFSELTAKRKAAEEVAEKARQEAKALREEREAIARERDELRAKYEAPKVPSAEPLPDQFTSQADFIKARDEWVADKTRREDAEKAEAARHEREQKEVAKAWNERQEAVKAKIPDYQKIIEESPVVVSDQVRDAIVESDVGPELLLHLAQHQDFAAELGKMTVSKALRELGKLEATLGGGESKPVTTAKAPTLKVVEVSKAPEPIRPLKGADAPLQNLKGSDPVPKDMDYDTWKELYQSGRIK